MAFILPIVLGSGITGIGGFVAGYMYNNIPSEASPPQLTVDSVITVQELKALKDNSPHKEINKELTTFDKTKLRKPSLTDPHIPADQVMIQSLRRKLSERRVNITDENIPDRSPNSPTEV